MESGMIDLSLVDQHPASNLALRVIPPQNRDANLNPLVNLLVWQVPQMDINPMLRGLVLETLSRPDLQEVAVKLLLENWEEAEKAQTWEGLSDLMDSLQTAMESESQDPQSLAELLMDNLASSLQHISPFGPQPLFA
jgi:hypothetical protein